MTLGYWKYKTQTQEKCQVKSWNHLHRCECWSCRRRQNHSGERWKGSRFPVAYHPNDRAFWGVALRNNLRSPSGMVKHPSAMRETWIRSLGWEDPLEKEMATHSSILAWRSHGQRSLAGYSPWGHKESDTTERLHFRYGGKSAINYGQDLPLVLEMWVTTWDRC